MFNKNKSRAIMLLTYYLRTLFEKTGLPFDQDNENEIKEIIECIFDVIIDEE
jgi:hypothetical protein